MSSFWESDTRVAYEQTSIAIPAENGRQFSENNKIVILVPADVNFFQPSESYLQCRVMVSHPTAAGLLPTRLQLDAELGGQVLIKNLRILTGTGILIEEIQDYNILANVISCYDTDTNIRNKKSITEGTTLYNPLCRIDVNGSNSSDLSPYNCANHNPYFTSPPDGQSVQQWVKLQLPLHSGIFRNKKIFPVVMTSGLKIEITLEEAKKCIHSLISSSTPAYAPFVHGKTATSAAMASGDAITSIALSKTKNNMIAVENCPFMVGERVQLADTDGSNDEDIGTIATIGISSGYVLITLAGSHTLTKTHTTEDTICLSNSITGTNKATYKPEFLLDDVELVLQKIAVPQNNVAAMMKAMKEQGVMKYDFLTFQNYRRSQLKGERQSTMALQLANAEIKSILSIGVETALLTTGEHVTDYAQRGLVGVPDHISNYIWSYNGALNPDRKIPMSKLNDEKIEQNYLVELEKALVVAGIPAKSFRKFASNVIIGRAMALQQGSYDGNGKDFNLQISSEETTAPALDKIWNNFICCVKSIDMSAQGVSIRH